MEGSGLVQEHHQEWVLSFFHRGPRLKCLSRSFSATDPKRRTMLGGKDSAVGSVSPDSPSCS